MADERRVNEPQLYKFAGQPEDSFRELGDLLRSVLKGQTNNYFNVEFEPNATQTVVSVEYARTGGIANFSAASQSAATAIAAGLIWTTVENGQFTVHHDSSSETGRLIGVTLAG